MVAWYRLTWLVVLIFSLRAEAANWARSFDSIRQAASSVKSVKAEFVQHKYLKILTRPIQSYGRFVFRGPDSIRWEYSRPIKSIMIMNSGDLARYTFHKGKWEKDASARVQALRVVVDEIQSWLTGRFEQSKAFSASLDSSQGKTIILEPKQKAMADIIERIVIVLDDKPGTIKRVEIVEGPDGRTVLDFVKVEINSHLGKDSFSPPR